jgi:hypothetical protein
MVVACKRPGLVTYQADADIALEAVVSGGHALWSYRLAMPNCCRKKLHTSALDCQSSCIRRV